MQKSFKQNVFAACLYILAKIRARRGNLTQGEHANSEMSPGSARTRTGDLLAVSYKM